ncbi:Protein of unknown function [Cotesia congregata]|uniref:Uncharacterized protein n=1 Tax=Cotesia congregata TaxID=51543 RepID=A0A8J2HIY1_COTCN|nr:Protein of unknown function [Cotesia congregata]
MLSAINMTRNKLPPLWTVIIKLGFGVRKRTKVVFLGLKSSKFQKISPYRRGLGWLTVKYRRFYFVVCFFYKLLEHGKPEYLRDLFVEESDVRRSDRLAAKRHTFFKIPNFTTSYFEKSYIVTRNSDQALGRITE